MLQCVQGRVKGGSILQSSPQASDRRISVAATAVAVPPSQWPPQQTSSTRSPTCIHHPAQGTLKNIQMQGQRTARPAHEIMHSERRDVDAVDSTWLPQCWMLVMPCQNCVRLVLETTGLLLSQRQKVCCARDRTDERRKLLQNNNFQKLRLQRRKRVHATSSAEDASYYPSGSLTRGGEPNAASSQGSG